MKLKVCCFLMDKNKVCCFSHEFFFVFQNRCKPPLKFYLNKIVNHGWHSILCVKILLKKSILSTDFWNFPDKHFMLIRSRFCKYSSPIFYLFVILLLGILFYWQLDIFNKVISRKSKKTNFFIACFELVCWKDNCKWCDNQLNLCYEKKSRSSSSSWPLKNGIFNEL